MKNGYWIFFKWLFWILDMNIQFFSFDWGELYWWFHNIESSLALLKLDLTEPWFIILLTQCSVLVTNFYYNFYINIHEWAWRSSLCSVWFECRCYFWLPIFRCWAWRQFSVSDFSVPWMFEIIYLRNHLGLVIRGWCIFTFFSDYWPV